MTQPRDPGVHCDAPAGDRPPEVPVLVDDVKRLGEGAFEMTRCSYFTVQVTTAIHDWLADLSGRGVAFLVLGPHVVLHGPEPDRPWFQDPGELDALFRAIEEVEGLVVETAHIWLPNDLVEAALGRDVMDDAEASRGELLRVPLPLFQHALRFVGDTVSAERFLAFARESTGVAWSPEESEVFRQWSEMQIEAAADNYAAQSQDERGVLPWRDDEGHVQAG